jgi:hypothetical protein
VHPQVRTARQRREVTDETRVQRIADETRMDAQRLCGSTQAEVGPQRATKDPHSIKLDGGVVQEGDTGACAGRVITMAMIGKVKRMYFREKQSVREIVRLTSRSRNTMKSQPLRTLPSVVIHYSTCQRAVRRR